MQSVIYPEEMTRLKFEHDEIFQFGSFHYRANQSGKLETFSPQKISSHGAPYSYPDVEFPFGLINSAQAFQTPVLCLNHEMIKLETEEDRLVMMISESLGFQEGKTLTQDHPTTEESSGSTNANRPRHVFATQSNGEIDGSKGPPKVESEDERKKEYDEYVSATQKYLRRINKSQDGQDLQTKMGGHDVFKTPDKNMTAAMGIVDTIPEETPGLEKLRAYIITGMAQISNHPGPAVNPSTNKVEPSKSTRHRSEYVSDTQSVTNKPKDARHVIETRKQARTDENNKKRKDRGTQPEAGLDRKPREGKYRYQPIIGPRAFTPELRKVVWPKNFKPQGLTHYDGKEDPEAWLQMFTLSVGSQGGDTKVLANALPIWLGSAAQRWFLGLRAESVESWDDLCNQFISNFQGTYERPPTSGDLMKIIRKKGETLTEFNKRFSEKKMSIPKIPDDLVVTAYRQGCKEPGLIKKMSKRETWEVNDLFNLANTVAHGEDAVTAYMGDRTRDPEEERKKNRDKEIPKSRDKQNHKRKTEQEVAIVERSYSRSRKRENYPKLLDAPCVYHPQGNHAAKDCRTIRHLAQYLNNSGPSKKSDHESENLDEGPERTNTDWQDSTKQVGHIFGGSGAFESKRSQKLTARVINATNRETPTYLKWSEVPITFSREDHPNHIPNPGRYPLILEPTVRNCTLRRVMVDGGSALNILFKKTFDAMGIPMSELKPSKAPFYGVVPGSSTLPLGQITLPVTFGTEANYRTERINFEVADFEWSYHAILGRPAIAKFMAIPNYTYLVMKMPAPNGVITLRGNTKRSYECDRETLEIAQEIQTEAERKEIRDAAAKLVDTGEVPTKKPHLIKIQPDQDMKTIQLDPNDPSKTTQIGSQLTDK